MDIERVGVIGFGLMGGGIAQVCAVHGYEVSVLDVDDERTGRGITTIQARLERDVSRNRMTQDTLDRAMRRIHGTTDYDDLAHCQLVIEAAVEDIAAKREVFKRLGAVTPPEAILASNT